MEFNFHIIIVLLLSGLFSIATYYLITLITAGDFQETLGNSVLNSGANKLGKKISPLNKIFFSLIISLSSIIALLPLTELRKKTEKNLVQAGRPANYSANNFISLQIISLGIAFFIGMFFDSELELSPALTLGFALLGIFYPKIWLNGLIFKRRQRIFRDLPDTLDVLRLATDAGMDLSSALKVVVDKGRVGPLLTELEQVEKEIALGKTRKEALKTFAERIGMQEINTFVLAIIQAEQLGSSIGPVLKTQGEMARTRRWQLAEILVNKLPMKMLGPLVVFIFPSSFIILFTPLLIQWFQNK